VKPSYPESQSMNRPVPRRAILGSFAAGVGLLGLQGAAAAPAQAARTTPMASQFVLHATGLRTPGGRRPRDVGAHYLVSGALRRSADGPAEGEFFAQATVVDRNHLSTSTPGSLQSPGSSSSPEAPAPTTASGAATRSTKTWTLSAAEPPSTRSLSSPERLPESWLSTPT
jgi:hypothetical protein